MKKVFLLVCLSALIIFGACKKNPGAGSPLKFISLVAADSVVKVNEATTITANATGDGLTYQWTKSYGTFVGSGATVQWFVCHQAALFQFLYLPNAVPREVR